MRVKYIYQEVRHITILIRSHATIYIMEAVFLRHSVMVVGNRGVLRIPTLFEVG